MGWSQPVSDYLDDLASDSPAPGGGASSALAGAVGCAQLSMVVALTLGNPRYGAVHRRMDDVARTLGAHRLRFLALADDDAEAYGAVARALRMPRGDDAERSRRASVLEGALEAATEAPFAIMGLACEDLELCREVAADGTAMAASDVTVAAALLRAAVDGSVATVLANTRWMGQKDRAARLVGLADGFRERGEAAARAAIQRAEEELR